MVLKSTNYAFPFSFTYLPKREFCFQKALVEIVRVELTSLGASPTVFRTLNPHF